MRRKFIIYNKEYINDHRDQAYNLMWELMARCVYVYGSRLFIEFENDTEDNDSFVVDFRPTDGSGKFLKDEDYVCQVRDQSNCEIVASFTDYGYACRWLTDLVTNNDFYSIYNFDTEDK